MKNTKVISSLMAGACVLTLAACGGGGGGDDGGGGGGGGGEIVLVSGIFDAELPAGSDRQNLPGDLTDLVDTFETANAGTLSDPNNEPLVRYNGTAGMSVDNGEDNTFLQADIALEADFVNNSINAGFQNYQVLIDGQSNSLDNPTYTPFQTATITDNRYTASTDNETVTFQGTDYTIQANIDGAFVGANAGTTIGLIDGSITGPDGVEGLDGLYVAGRD